jgi:hypothetical protein
MGRDIAECPLNMPLMSPTHIQQIGRRVSLDDLANLQAYRQDAAYKPVNSMCVSKL